MTSVRFIILNMTNMYSCSKMISEDLRKRNRDMILSKYKFPIKPSSDGYYHVYIKTETGRKQIKAKDLDNLKERVFRYETKSFKEVYGLVKEEKLKYVKNQEKLISVKNTLRVTDQIYNRFIAGSEIENESVANITKSDLEDFCLQTLRNQDVNKKAFLNMRSIIKSVMRYAYEQYWISDNPYTRIDFKKYNDLLVSGTPISKRVHTNEEIDRMLSYLHSKQNINPDYMPAWALELQILAGLRRGEIAPLEWSDIYDDAIHITKEMVTVLGSYENIIVNHTKTYTDRVFPVTDQIREFLDRLPVTSNYLFPNITNNMVYKLYSRMCKYLGIQISRDCIKGPHSFRRNGITTVCNAGGSIEMAATLYGNSPLSITKHYYTGINIMKAKAILDSNQKVTKNISPIDTK